MSSSTVLKVRAHLRIVSRSGHSQAVSRWAWPTMLTEWVAGAGRSASSSVEDRLGPAPTVGDVGELEQVAGPLEAGTEAGGVRIAVGKLGQQLDEDPEVVPELVELGVADVEVGLLEGEQGSAVRFGQEQGPRIGAERGRRVGGRLHEELDLLAAGGARGEQVLAVVGREALAPAGRRATPAPRPRTRWSRRCRWRSPAPPPARPTRPGTRPRRRNQVVSQGGPHDPPTGNGW